MTTLIGTFEVTLTPHDDADTPAGRLTIDKIYSGGLVGTGKGQMISKRIHDGPAVYFAIEEFNGQVDGIAGGFTLLHTGKMDANGQSLDVNVLEGSGTGALTGLTGSMTIDQSGGGHSYSFSYVLK